MRGEFERLSKIIMGSNKINMIVNVLSIFISRLVQAGANPNATSGIDCISACHLAALRTDGALEILLKAGANRKRVDRVGRTPLHLAAWAGNVKQVAILLGFSKSKSVFKFILKVAEN